MRSFRITTLTIMAAALAACSLVNSLDEVKPADDGRFTGESRTPPALTIDDAGFGPTSPINADAQTEGGTGTEFSPIIVGGEAVIASTNALAPVLTVLDSKTGQERGKRETMWVAGIAQDIERDVWYIFEAPNYFMTGATELTKIHIRRLDRVTGAWTELGVFEGPPLVYYDAIAVTTQRVSYVAHPTTDGSTTNRLVTVDTSNLASPVVNSELGLEEVPRGMTATPSKTGPGGTIRLLNTLPRPQCTTLDAGDLLCQARIRRYLIPNSGAASLTGTTLFGQMAVTGQPGFGSVTCGGNPDDVAVLPGLGPSEDSPTPAGLQTVKMLNSALSNETGSTAFTMSTTVGPPTLLRKIAVDHQRRIIFVVEGNNDTAVYAVPLDGAGDLTKTVKANLQHSGQSVYYDPSSSTVFAPFAQGDGKTFSPIRVTGTGKTGDPIILKDRVSSASVGGDWDAPTDLRPNFLGIRLTNALLECP